MSIHPFPAPFRGTRGTVHVFGDQLEGFTVTHESASGSSWGAAETYATGEEAITAAYTMNHDVYGGGCDVSVCDAARLDTAKDRF